ncbi:MAG: DUF2617 family protein [Pirellulales bacterium]
MLSVRPKIAELVFHLFNRSLHPELFEVYQSRKFSRSGFEAEIAITSAGHVIKWRHQGITLTEVAAAAHHPLPEKRRLFGHPLKGQRRERVECRGGVTYESDFQLERVEPVQFWSYQHDLAWESSANGMLHRFDASGRIALGALSFIHVETRLRSLTIKAFHTFPDDHAVVRTISRFQLP